MAIEVESDGESVILVTDDVESGIQKLTTRQAFDLVTDLLSAIDAARAFGEAKRREVPEPSSRGASIKYGATNARKARDARRARPDG
jgi:hypothetical protein